MEEVVFVNPLHVGETVYVDLEVIDTHDINRKDVGIVEMAMAVLTEDGTRISECVLTLLVRRRAELEWT